MFDSRNQLGLFSARWIDSAWSEITPFPYNSNKYSLTTPALSHDGDRIYFASNMPGDLEGLTSGIVTGRKRAGYRLLIWAPY